MAVPKTIALIANPRSGEGEAERVERALRAGGAEVVAFPPERGAEAGACGADRIVVAGGDGSIAPAAVAATAARVPLAVVPVGTANDFAAAFGLPDDAERATELARAGTRTRHADLAWFGERPFVNVASAGLAPAAARRAAGLKRALGSLAYLAGALAAAARARPVRCDLECEGRRLHAGRVWQATVGCSGAFGAGSSVGGEPGDGHLRLVAVPAGSRLGLLRRAHGMRRGTIGAQPGVAAAECRTAFLGLDPGTELNVDGELVESGPAVARIDPAAFELVVG